MRSKAADRVLPSQGRDSRSARSGFTLIEVLMAMSILVIGSLGIISILTFGAALSKTAALRTASSGAVEAVFADLEEWLFPLEPDGSVGYPRTIVDRPVFAAPGVLYSASAEENPDFPLEFRVDVKMKWMSSGVQRTQEFSTLLLREVPFGERMRRRFVAGSDDDPATADEGNQSEASND